MGGDAGRRLWQRGPTVSIHASAWEATSAWSGCEISARKFQSTPPRGRRHFLDEGLTPLGLVSIHASAWEATSQHPPAAQVCLCFNPRRRVGGDLPHNGIHTLAGHVSIHASAWEATRINNRWHMLFFVSIHASAWEATPFSRRDKTPLYRFQSTPPRGRRLMSGFQADAELEFQSTPPRGRRPGKSSRQ